MHDGGWFGMSGGSWMLPVLLVLVVVVLLLAIVNRGRK